MLKASVGCNLGFRLLPGAVNLVAAEHARLDDAFVGPLLWLDAFVMNPDRTPRNPNVLLWHRQPWAIDDVARLRAAYTAFLWKRRKAPRPFLSPEPSA